MAESNGFPEPDYDNLDYENLNLSFDDIVEDALEPGGGGAGGGVSNTGFAAGKAPDEEDDGLGKRGGNGIRTNCCSSDDDPPVEYILGTLIVRVVAARDLEPVDNGGLGKLLFGGGNRHGRGGRSMAGGTANPYASVRFGKTTQRSSEVFDSLDPIWPRGETMYMDVTHPAFPEEAPVEFVEDDQPQHKGDPPKKIPGPAKASSRAVAKAKAESTALAEDPTDPYTPDKPILTVALFHSSDMGRLHKFNPAKGPVHGDSDDKFLGMASVDLSQLLTGKFRTFDQWMPLTGTSSCRSSVRVVCEYESSDGPPRPGDWVRFTGFCHPSDLYPAQPNRLYKVEESHDDDVLVSWTSPEGWVSSFLVHRYMVVCEERHQGTVEFYQDELASLKERLTHSPLLNVVQDTVHRVPDDGLLSIGQEAFRNGSSLLNRWVEGGLNTAFGDIAYATNWDGRFNPDLNASLSALSEDAEGCGGVNDSMDPGNTSISDEGGGGGGKKLPDLPNMPSCPITGEAMRDPVVAADGHTYERRAIARWLKTSDKSPLTGSILPHKNLVPNYMLLSSLQEAACAGHAVTSEEGLTEEELR